MHTRYFSNAVFNKTTESLKDCFGQLKIHNEGSSGLISITEKQVLQKHAVELEISPTDSRLTENDVLKVKKADIDRIMLVEEIKVSKSISNFSNFSFIIFFFLITFKMLKFLSHNGRVMAFLILLIVFQIFLTILGSVASEERLFSRLN